METYYLQKLCILSTERVLIDIIVKISVAVDNANSLKVDLVPSSSSVF